MLSIGSTVGMRFALTKKHMNELFTDDQKQYLQGFLTAVNQSGVRPFAGINGQDQFTAAPGEGVDSLSHATPDDGTLFGTKLSKLCKEERLKLECDPLDMYEKMSAMAASGEYAEGGDVFRFKFHGLFNTAPIQEGYMLRTRIPGCVVDASQMDGLADIADNFGGGYSHVTTRGNLQIREIPATETIRTITKLYNIGLTSRGAGGDNIRNITASPVSGVDPLEIHDCSVLATAMHHTILNNREFYGLPRKFNICFDGGGAISIMSDTNDIAFVAVNGPDGVAFKVLVGGVTGHGHFARDTGLLLRPEQCVAYACGILRVFVKNGNRSNRKRARLAFVVSEMGMPGFLQAVQAEIDFTPEAVDPAFLEPRRVPDRFAHVGVHPQKQDGLNYIGVAMLVGKMTVAQMRGLACLAREHGDGLLRFTIWQNVVISGVPDKALAMVKKELIELGYHVEPSKCISGLAACTGNFGCKLSATDTKQHAGDIAGHFERVLPDGPPLGIVLTGCPNSCAQHFCADIGLLGVKTKVDGESVEAYTITLGGGTDTDQGLGREFAKAVPHHDVPQLLERVVRVYEEKKEHDESFLQFVRRQDDDQLKALSASEPEGAMA